MNEYKRLNYNNNLTAITWFINIDIHVDIKLIALKANCLQ